MAKFCLKLDHLSITRENDSFDVDGVKFSGCPSRFLESAAYLVTMADNLSKAPRPIKRKYQSISQKIEALAKEAKDLEDVKAEKAENTRLNALNREVARKLPALQRAAEKLGGSLI